MTVDPLVKNSTIGSEKKVAIQEEAANGEKNKEQVLKKEQQEKKDKGKALVPDDIYVPKLPFPQKHIKASLDKKFEEFVEVLKKLYVNIPLIDALQQIPSYAKFMKEICSGKKSLAKKETVMLSEDCSALILNKVVPIIEKQKDPGSFTIPCKLDSVIIDRALCDLGASVSVISSAIFKELDLRELEPTGITLQLADMTTRKPLGMLKDVVLDIGGCNVPVDFLVMEMEDPGRKSMILGRPFLATAGALIDVREAKLTFQIGEKQIEYKMQPALMGPSKVHFVSCVDVIKEGANEEEMPKKELNTKNKKKKGRKRRRRRRAKGEKSFKVKSQWRKVRLNGSMVDGSYHSNDPG